MNTEAYNKIYTDMKAKMDRLYELEAQIGQLEEGQHPDERKPRAETWLKERANWQDEVRRLREHIETQDMIIIGLEEGAEEWRMKCENLQVECNRLWQERNDLAQGKIDIRDDISPHSRTIKP